MRTEMNSAQSSETLSLGIFSFHWIWRHRLKCFLLTSFFIGTAQAGLFDDLYSYRRTYDLHSIDGAVDFILDYPLHLFSTLIAGGLAGAASAYGLVWLLLRKKLGRSLVWYAHIIGIAVAVVGGAVFRILAMFIYAGKDAIYPDAASGASGFYLLVIPALFALSYIWMLKTPRNLFGASSTASAVAPAQGSHDIMAGCLVLDASGSTQSAAPQAEYHAPFASASKAEATPSVSTLNSTVDEDTIYAAIANELKTGATDEGLWTRLFAECNGDETRTKVVYIKQRAERLIASEQLRLSELQRLRDEEANRIEKIRLESLTLRELREQLSAGLYSDEIRQNLKSLSVSYTAEMFFGKVLNNLLYDVEVLLKRDPLLVAVTSKNGDSPLHLAIRNKYVKMAQLLLESGSPLNLENMDGDTPLNLARKTGQKRLVDLLTGPPV